MPRARSFSRAALPMAACLLGAALCCPRNTPAVDASFGRSVRLGSPGRAPGQFLRPSALSFDAFGHLFVADRGNHRIQEFDESLQFVRERGGYGLGPGQFVDPRGVVADRGARVYVLDTPSGRIQTLDSRREPEAVLFDAGSARGFGPHRLSSLAVDAAGRMYLSDRENQAVLVLSPQGDSLGARGGFGAGPGQFRRIGALCCDGRGELWVLDEARRRVVHLDSGGAFLSDFPVAPDSLLGASRPAAIAISTRPLLAVADPGLKRVSIFTPEGGLLRIVHGWDGAGFDRPVAVAWSGDSLAVADEGTQIVTVHRPAIQPAISR